MYPNGQGSWARPGWGRSCARALPSWLALPASSSCYALAAQALPSQFALLAHGSGFALTTIKLIHLLQPNEFIYFALQNLWIHLQNLWIHKLNEFISKWVHLFEKIKNIKSTMGVEPCTNYRYSLCHTTNNLLKCKYFVQYKPIGALPSWQLLAVWYLGSIHSLYDM